ncbi:hypothetical protein LCGC14_1061290 [marine sediment metagenome]|uniref:Uncharacterized protein n=1 Tax=marine sediment metagenome TaxID=412755 RepID=A0A0F9ML36_9ZZZZ
MNKKILFLFVFFIFSIYLVSAIEECRGTITQEEVPCLVLLPVNTTIIDCTTLSTSFFNNASTLLYTQDMGTFNSFLCNATFNQSALGTYTFSYSTGDSGSIIVVVSNLNFFNLTVYLVLTAGAFIFMVFMHLLGKDTGSKMVYGWMATALNVIIGAIVLAPNFQVITGIDFFIDVDVLLAGLHFVLAFYTAIASINFKRSLKPEETESVSYSG